MLKFLKLGIFLILMIPIYSLLNFSYKNLNESLIQTFSEVDGTERLLSMFKDPIANTNTFKMDVQEIYNKSELVLDPEIITYYLGSIYADCFIYLYTDGDQYQKLDAERECIKRFEIFNRALILKSLKDEKIDKLYTNFRNILNQKRDNETEKINELKLHQLDGLSYLKELLLKRIESKKSIFWRNVSQFFIILIITYILIFFIFNLYEKKIRASEQSQLKNSKLAMVGELTSSIGHEMATPLSVLNLNISKALRELESEKVEKNNLSKYLLTSQKMINLILSINKSIRSLALTTNSSQELTAVNVDKIIEDVKLLVEYYASKNNTELVFNTNKNLDFKVLGIDHEILQILTNLIKNGVDACAGSETRKIFFEIDNSNETMSFIIEDTGMGVNNEQARKIFEPLFTTKINKGGTGLGLSISLKMAKDMQGDLRLTELKNKYGGATFALILKKLV